MLPEDSQIRRESNKSSQERYRRWLSVIVFFAFVFLLTACSASSPKTVDDYLYESARDTAKKATLALELDGLVVDGQGTPIPDAVVYMSVIEYHPESPNRLPFEDVKRQKVTDSNGLFSYRGKGDRVWIKQIEGPGEWLYDLDTARTGTNRSNVYYESDMYGKQPYKVKRGAPAVFVLVREGQPVSVMPQRGGIEIDPHGEVKDNGPAIPWRPSVPLTPDPEMRTGVQIPRWITPRDKLDTSVWSAVLDREIDHRLHSSASLRATIGAIQDPGLLRWKYEERNGEHKNFRRLCATRYLKGESGKATIEVMIHLTREGFRPVTMLARPRNEMGQQPPIPLWTKEEITKGIAQFHGTTAQCDALFDGWETDARAAVNVIEWMKITRPVVWPYPVD